MKVLDDKERLLFNNVKITGYLSWYLMGLCEKDFLIV